MPYKDKAKRNEYARLWVARRRAEWFADKSCVVCDSKKNLEIHHIDPETKVSHSVWSWNKEHRDAELLKCEVRCEEHHKVATKEQQSTPLSEKKHGTWITYGRHGCRCEECREWQRQYHKKFR